MLRSALWAVPAGIVFALPVGYAVLILTLLVAFSCGSFVPSPHGAPFEIESSLADVIGYPGMVFAGSFILTGPIWLGLILFGFPYAWLFSFFVFTSLGCRSWYRSIDQ